MENITIGQIVAVVGTLSVLGGFFIGIYNFIKKVVLDKINKNTTIKFISSASASETLNKTTLKASSKNGKATLKWSAVVGAERYQIYVSTDGGKTYSRYKTYKSTVLKSTYTMTKGKTYKFKIRSYKTVDGKKVYSKWSNVKTIKY